VLLSHHLTPYLAGNAIHTKNIQFGLLENRINSYPTGERLMLSIMS
jgi:hypothetical protein